MALFGKSPEGLLIDGSVTDSAMPSSFEREVDLAQMNQNKIRVGRIDQVNFTDQKTNGTAQGPNPNLTYNCTFVGGSADMEKSYGVIDANAGGGKYNKKTKVRKPLENDEKKQGSGVGQSAKCSLGGGKTSDQEKAPERTTGDFVLLACIDGFSDSWVILQDYPHPLADKKHTEEDGFTNQEEYNGVVSGTDKDGNYSVSQEYGGPRDPKTGKGKNESEATSGSGDSKKKTSLGISAKGVLEMKDKNDSEFTMDPQKKSLTTNSAGDMLTKATGNVERKLNGTVQENISGAYSTIRKGLTTSKSAFELRNGGGTNIARVGDKVICPKGTVCTIATGSKKMNSK